MWNKKISARLIGYLMFLPALLLLFGGVMAVLFLSAFGFGSGVSLLQMLPFLVLMFFVLSFSGFCVYLAVRYLKNKPFKPNHQLGTVLVLFSLVFFFFSLINYVLGNLFGNEGAFLRPIISFVLLLILLPLGLGFKNGYKKD